MVLHKNASIVKHACGEKTKHVIKQEDRDT